MTGLLFLLLTPAIAGPGKGPSASAQMPADTVRLRSAFDQDPSSYLGRFVTPGDEEIDETSAMPTLCSQYIGFKMVPGGNVTYDELVEVSSKVAARFNIPLIARGSGSSEGGSTTRVRYTLTGKLQAEVTDPEAFAACCTERPDQCTDRFVGEFLQGTGEVFRVQQRDSKAGVEVNTPQGGGEASMVMGQYWEQSIQFAEPVYFAFKLTETPYRRVGSACGAWVSSPPQILGGTSFVGVTRKAQSSELKARKQALSDARAQAIKIGAGMPEEGPLSEALNVIGLGKSAMRRKMDHARTITVEAREWCVEQDDGGFTARVLAFVPDAS